jgi:formylglycine-generating enzyme required for sulfatase activity
MPKKQMVLLLLTHCLKYEQMPDLLTALKEDNAAVYAIRLADKEYMPTRIPAGAPKPVRDPRKVFVSHAHEDQEFAHQLADDLQKRGWRAWIAPDSIRPGEPWGQAINRGLEECGIFVLLLTPYTTSSRWVSDEAYAAMELEKRGMLRFFSLAIQDCDVPPLWNVYQHVSFVDGYADGLAVLLEALGPGSGESIGANLGGRLEIAPKEPPADRPPTRTEASTPVDARLEAPEMRLESPGEGETENAAPVPLESVPSGPAEQAGEAKEPAPEEAAAQEKAQAEKARRKVQAAAKRKATAEAKRKAQEAREAQEREVKEQEARRKKQEAKEQEAKAQEAREQMYARLQTAYQKGEWLEVIELGAELKALGGAEYRDAQNLVAQAKEQLKPPKPPVIQVVAKPEAKPPQPAPPPAKPEVKVWPKDGKEMIRIPAGEFLYGEKKQKKTLPEFWIDKTPVTNAEYARFVAETSHSAPRYWKGTTPPKDKLDHPVVEVSWQDAMGYAQWSGKRLPTAEEWEKAARGKDGREYPWGAWEPGHCNTSEAGVGDTTPVGQYSPQGDSPYSCVDMAGNVWEWTANDFVSIWLRWGEKVQRGGSWFHAAPSARCACRDFNATGCRYDYGFRCVVGSGW